MADSKVRMIASSLALKMERSGGTTSSPARWINCLYDAHCQFEISLLQVTANGLPSPVS